MKQKNYELQSFTVQKDKTLHLKGGSMVIFDCMNDIIIH